MTHSRAQQSKACRIKLMIFVGILAPFGAAHAQDAAWKIGLARVKITPTEPVRMAGYGSRDHASTGVASELHAKALAIEDRNGQRAVIVTSDVIGFTAAFAEPVCRRIAERTGLDRSRILLNASHTHTGPTLTLDDDEVEGFTREDTAATVRYTRRLQDTLVDLVVRSFKGLEPARLSWGLGVAPFVMNRREFTERGVVLGFNPRGHIDRSVPILRVDTPDGKMRAVLYGAACHNTTLTGRHYEISGDFAGYSQVLIEREHPGAQAMFMQGCAGDANPHPRGSEAFARQHGDTLGREVMRILDAELRPVRGPLRIAFKRVALPLQPAPSRSQLDRWAKGGGWRGFVGKQMTALLEREGALPTTYTTPFTVWQFGGDLTLVGLPGEVVVDYVTLIEKALGPRRLWIAAYCNDVFGYLPSAKVLSEGGYETRGLYSGGIGFFTAQAQDVATAAVLEMARSVGRPMVR